MIKSIKNKRSSISVNSDLLREYKIYCTKIGKYMSKEIEKFIKSEVCNEINKNKS